MNKRKMSLKASISILIIVSAVILLVRHFHIADFRVVEPGVLYTSGQPRGMDYTRLLYNYHIATILNVRPASEHRERNWYNEEIIWARNNGVRHIEMPIAKNDYFPTEQHQQQFIKLMSDKDNLPLLLHGSEDDKRVAMLVAAWLKKSCGYDLNQTVKAVKKIIDDRELTENEMEFIRQLTR